MTIDTNVQIARTLDENSHVPQIGQEITCSEATKARIQALGLQEIAFNKHADRKIINETLREKMWEKAHLLKDRLFKKDADLLDAINFLELFSMYSLQDALIHDDIDYKITPNLNGVYEYSPVMKLVRELEVLAKMPLHGNKAEQKVLKMHIERALRLTEKLFTQIKNPAEAQSLVKYINKSEKIFRKFI